MSGQPDAQGGRSRSRTGRLRWTARLLGIVLSVAAVAILLSAVDLRETGAYLMQANGALLLLAAAVVFLQLATVTLRWSFLLPPAPDGRVPWAGLLVPVSLGYLGNFVLPARLGELVRSGYASRRWRIGLAPTIGSVVLERVIDTAVLAAVALIAAILLGSPGWIIQIAAIAAAAGTTVVFVLAGSLGQPIARWLRTRDHAPLVRAGHVLGGFLLGAAPDRRTAIAPAALLSAVSWVLEGTVYWLVATAVGVDATLPEALLVAAVTVLATAIPAAPAYVGTFELAATAAAGSLGIAPAAGLAWAVLAHVVTVAPLMVAGVVALIRTGVHMDELVSEARSAEDELDHTPRAAPTSS